ncbi:MAG: 50S ribosomal protein L17 [Verrucomicrobiales bacterium]
MRHQNKVKKLQRPAAHRRALLANLVCSLIEHKQIRTTVAKAKAMRPIAERMVTLGKRGDIHARRVAASFLRHKSAVSELFEQIAPAAASRAGGYTRIIKLGPRMSDSAPMAFISWVDQADTATDVPVEKTEESKGTEGTGNVAKKTAKKRAAKKATTRKTARKAAEK